MKGRSFGFEVSKLTKCCWCFQKKESAESLRVGFGGDMDSSTSDQSDDDDSLIRILKPVEVSTTEFVKVIWANLIRNYYISNDWAHEFYMNCAYEVEGRLPVKDSSILQLKHYSLVGRMVSKII